MQAPYNVLSHARPRLLTRAEYDRLVSEGLFARERVELVRGIVVEMSRIGPRHADPVDFLGRIFVRALGDRAVVRVQQPPKEEYVQRDEWREHDRQLAEYHAGRHPECPTLQLNHCFDDVPGLANVPPLSSGRIRKGGGVG